MNIALSRCKWELELNSNCFIPNKGKFYSVSNDTISKFISLKTEKCSSYPVWYSSELISHIIRKQWKKLMFYVIILN